MLKFHIARLLAIIFGTISFILVMLFYIYRDRLFPDIKIGIIVVLSNFICLVVSLLFYVWQKTHRNMPRRREREVLETYARLADEGVLQSGASDVMAIDAEAFWRLQQYGDTVTISVAKMNPLRVPQVGARAMVAPLGNPDNTVVVKVVKREGELMTVSPAGDVPSTKR